VTAGIAKLFGKDWRSGWAITGILSTRTYGHPGAVRILSRAPWLSRALCYTTIAFELSFIAAPVLPIPILCVLLFIAGGFHLGCAYLMGLNGFFWAFVSTFPAIIFLNQSVTSLLMH
jgi:hypothetical protein